jgi:hypothetical protein
MDTHKDDTRNSLLRRWWSRDFWSRRPATEGVAVHSEIQFERSDINARDVMLTGASILLGTWVSVVLLYFLFEYFVQVHKEVVSRAQATAAETVQLPPEPRLQRSPARDWQEMKAQAEGELNSYGWVDKQKQIVSIPIDQAMDLVVQRGIAPQAAPPKMFYPPQEGSPLTGFEGKVEPKPR